MGLPKGVVKIKEGEKMAWLSFESKNGWSLGLALGKRTVWVRGLRFKTKKEVARVIGKSNLVFVAMKTK